MDIRLIGLAVLVAIIACGTSYCKGIDVGKEKVRAEMQKDLDKANAKTAELEKGARQITEEQGREIEKLRKERDDAFTAARGALKPVRLCKQSASGGQVSGTPSPSATVDSPDSEDGVPVSAGRDIGPELVSLVERCQRDHDVAVGWQEWYAQQSALTTR